MSIGAIDVAATEARIAELDQEIKRAEATIAGIESQRAPLERAATLARWQLSRLRFKRWIRGPAQSYGLWKLGLLLTGTALAVAVSFVLSDLFIYSVRTALLISVLTAVAASGAFGSMLYLPSDLRVTDALVDAEIESKVAETRVAHQCATDGLQDKQIQLSVLLEERCAQLAKLHAELTSEMRQRRSLLQQDWRGMRDDEWEEYLVRVFHALGANARRIGGAGDQGVDLIVEIGPRRIAVQAKGYLNAVSNKAIQEAFTGKVHHKCTDCAVITNSRFTQGAHDIAASTGCILIGEDEFADLVIGKIRLLELARPNQS